MTIAPEGSDDVPPQIAKSSGNVEILDNEFEYRNLYTVLTKDHSRYENPHWDLGSPTNPSLAWWSWEAQINKDTEKISLQWQKQLVPGCKN